MEHRPGGSTLRSLCDSDILLVNQGGKQTAYYVEAEKFQELPDSFAAQLSQQNKVERAKRKYGHDGTEPKTHEQAGTAI